MSNYTKKFKSTAQSERGVSILEFTLVAGIFFMTLLAFFDFARYFTLQAIITRGAQNGLDVAKIIDGMQIDPQNIGEQCEEFANNPEAFQDCVADNYQKLLDARSEVILAATNLPLTTFASPPDSGGNFSLNKFEITDTPNIPIPSMTLNHSNLSAIVIRPGESAKNDTYDKEIVHPQICPIATGTCDGDQRRRRAPTENLKGLLRTFPLVVEVTATIDPLFPFFESMPVVGRAIGYREVNSGSVTGELPMALACQNPPPCDGPNMVLTSNCQCVCTLNCPPVKDGHWAVKPGGFHRVPDPTCTFCACDMSENYCNGGMQGKDNSPSSCGCGCYAQYEDENIPSTDEECQKANGDFTGDSYWAFYSYGCFCRCPRNLAKTCLNNEDMGYNSAKCTCEKCDDYTDPTCSAACPIGALKNKCYGMTPPQEIDPVTCKCVETCDNPPPCTNGTLTNCTTCNCPTCPSPKVRDTTGGDCGACICGPTTEVGQGCDPFSTKPNPNLTTCLCETPGGGPSS